MNANDFDEFTAVINSTMELYSKPPLSEFALSIWWNALQCYTLSEVKGGLTRHIRNPDNGQFQPKPADVVRAIGGTSQDNSAVAWSKIDKAVRQIGPYHDVVFDDPCIHAVLEDMGGWIRLGSESDKTWPFIQKEFESRYRGLMTRGVNNDYPRRLTGITNADRIKNAPKNEPPKLEPPMMIGNEQKAMLVLQNGVSELGGQKSIGQIMRASVISLEGRRSEDAA